MIFVNEPGIREGRKREIEQEVSALLDDMIGSHDCESREAAWKYALIRLEENLYDMTDIEHELACFCDGFKAAQALF